GPLFCSRTVPSVSWRVGSLGLISHPSCNVVQPVVVIGDRNRPSAVQPFARDGTGPHLREIAFGSSTLSSVRIVKSKPILHNGLVGIPDQITGSTHSTGPAGRPHP